MSDEYVLLGLVKNVSEYAATVGETVKTHVQDAVGGRRAVGLDNGTFSSSSSYSRRS